MLVSDLMNSAQSISGDYKLVEKTPEYNSFMDAVNRAMEQLVFDAQPNQLLKNITFLLKADAPSDFVQWKPPYSEDDERLKKLLNTMKSSDIPDISSDMLSSRIYQFHESSSARTVVENSFGVNSSMGIYALINGISAYITYNEDLFSRSLPVIVSRMTTASFTLSTAITLPLNACSLYVRVMVYDKSGGRNSLLADILFDQYKEIQSVAVNNISCTLNVRERRVTVGSTKGNISNYYCEVYGRSMPTSPPTVLLIRNNNVYANGNMQLFMRNSPTVSISFRAFVLPPYMILGKQRVSPLLTSQKSLLEVFTYKIASLYRRSLGHIDSYLSLSKIGDFMLEQYRSSIGFSKAGELQYNVITL